jgi:hypothetical protein
MNRLKWVAAVALLCALQSGARADLLFKGMSYANFDTFGGNYGSYLNFPSSFMSMQTLGVNTVALNVWNFTPTPQSTSIAPDYTQYSSTDAQVVAAINTLHSEGMTVLLKPMLDVSDGIWRGVINPSASNLSSWFSNYDAFIDHYATIAAANNVNLFSVGCELNGVEKYTANWTNLISGVRGIYGAAGDTSERLTYAANWTGNEAGHGGFTAISWWNQLDYIGIDAYFPLASVPDPSEAELLSSWGAYASEISQWRSAAGLSQPVIFTEAGYEAKAGTASSPGGTGDASTPQDIPAQANAYQALLQTMAPEPWFDGVFWWEWSPFAPPPDDNGFDPQNKPQTEAVIASYYLPEPGSAGLTFLSISLLLQARRRCRQLV